MNRTKKDIDKELMYKKLMPSEPRNARAPVEQAAAEKVSPVASGGEEAPQAADFLSAAGRVPEPRRVSVPILDNRQTEVINVIEAAVLSKLESVLSRFQCCRCDRCKKDIVALSLNKLPPKYMVLPQGQVPPDLDSQQNAQILTAMIQAVIKVRAKPRH